MKHLFTLLFFFTTLIFSKAEAQTITTVAGNGTAGYTGDSGLAVNAALNQPVGVDVDAFGNIYIADTHNNVVRKVNAKSGVILTIAGNGTQGFNGDSGLATNAQLSLPSNVIVDNNNNIYINEWGNNRIRKVDAKTGVITTIAGGGSSQQDTVLAIDASIFPEGIALNNAGTALYIAETIGGGRIRKVDLSTDILATIVNPHYPLEPGSYYGSELTLDSANNIYVSCNDGRIRKIDAITNIVTIIAGNGISNFSGDGDSAIKAEFSLPEGIGFDSAQNFYIADFGNSRLRKINSADSIVNTTAGNGVSAYNGDNIPAINAQLSLWGIKIDMHGDIYIADINNNRIRKITSGVLPLQLLSFTTQKQNEKSLLQWQTISEINNSYFDVERSPDSKLFYSIGTKQGSNNNGVNNYSFNDNSPLAGVNYYRLKQVDKDSKFSYSQIASIIFEHEKIKLYPNPSHNGKFTFKFSSTYHDIQILVTDETGHIIYNKNLNQTDNINLYIPNNRGTYFAEIKHDNVEEKYKLVID